MGLRKIIHVQSGPGHVDCGFDNASSSSDGFMSSTDKTKLDTLLPGGGFSITSAKIANYTAKYSDLVRVDSSAGAFTVTLPACATLAAGAVIVKGQTSASANAITVAAGAGDTIDGGGSVKLYGTESLYLISDGATNWIVLDPADSFFHDFNVKYFGAKGDNATDDTAAIQAAINAAGTNPFGRVLVPAGVYKLTAALSFSQVTGIQFLCSGEGATIFTWSGGAGGTMMSISGSSRCKFSGFQLQGSGDTTGILFNGKLAPNVSSQLDLFEHVRVASGCAYGARVGTVAFQCSESMWIKCNFVSCTTAGVSIEDANAVNHDFYDSEWNFCDAGITAIQGTGGSFNLYGCGYAGNGVNNSSATSYDIAVYPSSRGTAISGCWSEGGYRFLRTTAGSTATQVTLTECSVNGMTDSTGGGAGLGIGIIWEASGGLNIEGGKYQGTYQGVSSALQIQVAGNNNRRANINIDGTTFADNPFQTTSVRSCSVHLRGVQIKLVMDLTAPATTEGFLQRGTQGAPINFTSGNTMIFSAAAWLSIASNTALAQGDNIFTIASSNCQGSAMVRVDTVKSWGGIAASNGILLTPADAAASSMQLTITTETAFTLTSALQLYMSLNPQIFNAV